MSHHDLSLDDVKRGLADGSVLLVDVREDGEFAQARIPGSVSLPLSRFDPDAIAPAPGQRVVFSCAVGIRSLRAVDASLARGLRYDAHYLGGLKDWMMAGEPVETG